MKKKKINKLLHKWLSIPLGLIIFVICITGALLVFQQEILELSNPSHYFVEQVKGSPIPLNELVPMINSKLEDNSSVANIKISDNPARTYTMGLAEGFRVSVFVNQYTGEITGRYAVKEHGFFTIMALHRWLLDSTQTWGKCIVGWTTVLFVIIIITGLFYLSWRSKRKYKILFNKGTKTTMFGLHNSLGLYGALILIVCSLSGLMWSFDWFRNSVFALAGAEKLEEQAPRGGGRGEQKDKKPEVNTAMWQVALENTMKADANYDYIRISDGLAALHPNSTYRTRVLDQYKFDKNSGEITEVTPFAKQDVRTRVWAWTYSLHVGDYWGVWSKTLTFFFCLVGASLPITGYYFWIKRWINKRKRLKKKQLATK